MIQAAWQWGLILVGKLEPSQKYSELTGSYSGYDSKAVVQKGRRPLDFDSVYDCPNCGCGQLAALCLMDVYACDFCRHLFTANLQNQSVQLADSLHPMAWIWMGDRWQKSQQAQTAAALVWFFAVTLAVFPESIIAISNYIFPSLEGSSFPLVWTGLTLVCHVAMSLWLLAEYHRWPWFIASGIRLRRLRERLL